MFFCSVFNILVPVFVAFAKNLNFGQHFMGVTKPSDDFALMAALVDKKGSFALNIAFTAAG